VVLPICKNYIGTENDAIGVIIINNVAEGGPVNGGGENM
jgi:hypothetical protein